MAILETKRVIVQPRRRKMSKRRRTIELVVKGVALATFAFAVAFAVYMIGIARYDVINLSELTSATLTGYDGNGTLDVETEVLPEYGAFFETLKVEILESDKTKNGELSNGDKLEIEYSYDKDMAKSLGLKVKGKKETVTVKDLPEATVISKEELFSGISVETEGVAPMMTVNVINNTTDEVLKTVEFSIVDPRECYDDGDVVTIRASFDSETLAKYTYEIEGEGDSLTKDYTVTSKERYLTDISEVPDELLEEMKSKGATLFGTEPGDANEFGLRIFSDAGKMYSTEGTDYTSRFTTVSFISAYFACVTDEHIGEQGTHYNDVKIVYDTAISQNDGETVAAEAVVIFRNLIKKEDGSIEVNLDEGQIISVSRRDEQIKNLVRCTDDDTYVAVKFER